MKVRVFFFISIGFLFLPIANGSTADQRHNISGQYLESGKTIRASPGAPQGDVAFCARVSLFVFQSPTDLLHSRLTVTQTDDLVVEFVGHSERGGGCRGTFTKADGLQVTATEVILPLWAERKRRDQAWHATYHFRLDEETGLWINAEFIKAKGEAEETGEYFFPRIAQLRTRIEQGMVEAKPDDRPNGG